MTDFLMKIIEIKKLVKSKEPELQKDRKIQNLLQNIYGEAQIKERQYREYLFDMRIREIITELNSDREQLIKKQEKLTKKHYNIKDEDKKRLIYDDIKLLDGEIRRVGKFIHDLSEYRGSLFYGNI